MSISALILSKNLQNKLDNYFCISEMSTTAWFWNKNSQNKLIDFYKFIKRPFLHDMDKTSIEQINSTIYTKILKINLTSNP